MPALEVSATVLDTLLLHLILPCLESGQKDEQEKARQAGWERVANSLLSGVIV